MQDRWLATAYLVLLTALANPASAQDENTPDSALEAASAEQPNGASELGADNEPQTLADSLEGQARRDYAAARMFYGNGDYTQASTKFQRAYEASNDPRLLWNLAACELKLFHYARAGALMRRFLQSDSPLITRAKRKKALAFVEATERLTVGISIDCNEPDASVYLDGEQIGSTPLRNLRADLGRHEIRVQKHGFAEHARVLTITGSADLKLDVQLDSLTPGGQVSIHASKGDMIELDGERVAFGSFRGQLPIGPHQVRISAPGARPYESEVVVRKGLTHTLRVTLPREAKAPPGVPSWAWWVGGSVLAAGAGTLGYFLLRPESDGCQSIDSDRCVQLPP